MNLNWTLRMCFSHICFSHVQFPKSWALKFFLFKKWDRFFRTDCPKKLGEDEKLKGTIASNECESCFSEKWATIPCKSKRIGKAERSKGNVLSKENLEVLREQLTQDTLLPVKRSYIDRIQIWDCWIFFISGTERRFSHYWQNYIFCCMNQFLIKGQFLAKK